MKQTLFTRLTPCHLKEEEDSKVTLLISIYYINYSARIPNAVVKMTHKVSCALIGKTEKDLLSLLKKKIFFFLFLPLWERLVNIIITKYIVLK